MKNKKNNRPIFLITLGISTVIIAFFGIMGKNSLYAGYDVDIVKVPQLAVVFQGIKDAKYPWDILEKETTPSTDEKNRNEDTEQDNDITDAEANSDLDKHIVENTEEPEEIEELTTDINKSPENTDAKSNNTQKTESLSQNTTANNTTGKTKPKGNTAKSDTKEDKTKVLKQ